MWLPRNSEVDAACSTTQGGCTYLRSDCQQDSYTPLLPPESTVIEEVLDKLRIVKMRTGEHEVTMIKDDIDPPALTSVSDRPLPSRLHSTMTKASSTHYACVSTARVRVSRHYRIVSTNRADQSRAQTRGPTFLPHTVHCPIQNIQKATCR